MIETYVIDERTKIRVGYSDGHVEVEVDLPFPLNVVQSTATRSLPLETVQKIIPVIRRAIRTINSSIQRR